LYNYLCISFNDTALGITYWRKNKNKKCYKCGKTGHLSEDCEKVCKSCFNKHAKGICVFKIKEWIKKTHKILKGAVVTNPEQIMNKIEKLKEELIVKEQELKLREIPCDTRVSKREISFTIKPKEHPEFNNYIEQISQISADKNKALEVINQRMVKLQEKISFYKFEQKKYEANLKTTERYFLNTPKAMMEKMKNYMIMRRKYSM
jgi:hypothetical protein